MNFNVFEMENEYFVSIKVKQNHFKNALDDLVASYLMVRASYGLNEDTEIWVRVFLSDIHNQNEAATNKWDELKTSFPIFIGQSPIDSTYISLLAYHIKSDSVRKIEHSFGLNYTFKHGEYTTHLRKFYPLNKENQQSSIIQDFQDYLLLYGLSADTELIRSWIYLRDIENNYLEFDNILKKDSFLGKFNRSPYFIGTRVGGSPSYSSWINTSILTLSISNLPSHQTKYLNTTYSSMPFRTAMKIMFSDRDKIYLSAISSIDENEKILFEGDVVYQTKQIIDNIISILIDGDMNKDNVAYLIVYVRDPNTYSIISNLVEHTFGNIPIMYVNSSSGREQILLSIDGEAIKKSKNEEFLSYI